MDAEIIINKKIIQITAEIQNEFPELSKYLNEMTITIPAENNPKIDSLILQNYYDSLNKILTSYKLEIAAKNSSNQ